MADTTAGIIAIGERGEIEFQAGLGTIQHVKKAVLAWHHDRANVDERLHAIPSEKLIVLALPIGSSTIYLLHDSRDEQTLLAFVSTVDIAYSVLNQALNSVTVVDDEAKLRYISSASAAFLGLTPSESIGRPVMDVIQNSQLPEVLRTGKSQVGQLQVGDKATRIVSRRPVWKNGRVVGAFSQLLFKAPEQLHELSREIARLKSEVNFYQRELSVVRTQSYGLEQIVGSSAAMRELKSNIARIAPLDVPVLIEGESGTGKELIAHAVHNLSGRGTRPLVVVNAAALPANLVESEMFGYEPGAFTGADRKGRKGKFEAADKSTLFLDEVGDMPLEIQVKVLRVLQDGMFERIGSDRARYSGFRLICASNRDVQQLVTDDKFRLDLYYRISAVTLYVPPLRERLDDIPLLVENFLEAYARRHQTSTKHVDPRVYTYLRERPWPGNVRQLLHELERAAIFCDRDELTVSDFEATNRSTGSHTAATSTKLPGTISAARESVELKLIKDALIRHKGNKSRVADELGISRSHLYKKLTLLAKEAP